MTLEEQLDALIAEHRLSSITLSRIAVGGGDYFWDINAQGDGKIGSPPYTDRPDNAGAGVATAIEALNAKRCAAVVVPELEALS